MLYYIIVMFQEGGVSRPIKDAQEEGGQIKIGWWCIGGSGFPIFDLWGRHK